MWPPFGKELPARLTLCYLCILSFFILVISRFRFEGKIWVLIAPVPGYCRPVVFGHLYLVLFSQLLKYNVL